MINTENEDGSTISHSSICNKKLKKDKRIIKCESCAASFHMGCHRIKYRNKTKEKNWMCKACTTKNKIKCHTCRRTIAKTSVPLNTCSKCKNKFHKKCAKVQSGKNDLVCNECTASLFPYFNINDNEFLVLSSGNKMPADMNLEILPSFSIKTLLDKLPGNVTIQTGDFSSDYINSKYYTPIEFQQKSFSKNNFSVLHINIASLQAHMDEFKELIRLLDHPFDVIGISETKLQKNKDPIVNLEIEGYYLEHMPTETCFGGVALYIKKCYDQKLRSELSQSVKTVGESIFVEIEQKRSKNILVGCFYRHHSLLSNFNEELLKKTLVQISKEKSKICILLGDWNANLLDYENHKDTEDFYEILSSYSFQPLILQPTRVNRGSATLIDNIFINDLTISSNGGNIVTSISDHFPQFCSLNIFRETQKTKSTKKHVATTILIRMNSKMK